MQPILLQLQLLLLCFVSRQCKWKIDNNLFDFVAAETGKLSSSTLRDEDNIVLMRSVYSRGISSSGNEIGREKTEFVCRYFNLYSE